jgi:hypothetical protein
LNNEQSLYQQLQKSQTTFISVRASRSSFEYHQWVLELLDDSSWRLVSIDDHRFLKISVTVSLPKLNLGKIYDDYYFTKNYDYGSVKNPGFF